MGGFWFKITGGKLIRSLGNSEYLLKNDNHIFLLTQKK